MNVTLYFDGNKNSSGVSCSFRLTSVNKAKHETIILPAKTTVPQAEYMGLLSGLSRLNPEVYKKINLTIYGDSKLVCSQVSKVWECKNQRLRLLRDRALNILENLGSWKIEWIPREKNLAG